MRQKTFRWLSKWLNCRAEYYMPTSISVFVWVFEERAKWVEMRAKRDAAIRAIFGQ